MLSDYHLHTPLCLHAEGHPREYAAQAVKAGLSEIGFSDHNPMAHYFDDWRMLIGDFPRYLEMVDEARADFPALPVRLGLECDYIEGRETWTDEQSKMANFDYLIGSVHYIAPGWDVDNPKHLSRWRESGMVLEIWERYWQLYVQMIRRRQFDFYAHPDLPKKFGLRPAGDLRRFYEPAIQALVDTNGVFEVSTAGLRKDCREMYPSREFLTLAFEAGVPIVISSDSHAPNEVVIHIDQALALVREVGYRTSVRFHQRQRSEVALPEIWPLHP